MMKKIFLPTCCFCCSGFSQSVSYFLCLTTRTNCFCYFFCYYLGFCCTASWQTGCKKTTKKQYHPLSIFILCLTAEIKTNLADFSWSNWITHSAYFFYPPLPPHPFPLPDSSVFLAEQFESLQSHLDAMMPAAKKPFLQQFYSQVTLSRLLVLSSVLPRNYT